MKPPASERDLAAAAAALTGRDARMTQGERVLATGKRPPEEALETLRASILAGEDPLGAAFCRLRAPETRRAQGAVYTPSGIVQAMIGWAAAEGAPARIVDPGAGSGRFVLAAARAFPNAELIGIELDPLAALLLRANAAVLGMTDRLDLRVEDYREAGLPRAAGDTLFIGNPPYVRHHGIPKQWKRWLAEAAAAYGLRASKLAGLHVHFFMRTRQLARPGDYGAFITSAEWLDVNYGSVLRKLLGNGLGGLSVHVVAAAAMPFADAAATAAVTCFRIGSRARSIRLRRVATPEALTELGAGRPISWPELDKTARWSALLGPRPRVPSGHIELGELCRVHRGQVTGNNALWIDGGYSGPLPASVLLPTVTKARELFAAGRRLVSGSMLRRVIDLPRDLEGLDEAAREDVARFLRWAKRNGASESYIARHRRPWWSVGLRPPAPILCTYMARRPPAFVRNLCDARHLNIAHGIYPRADMPASALDALASWLASTVSLRFGRTYAGGLTKFEPKELERIPIPPPEALAARAAPDPADGRAPVQA